MHSASRSQRTSYILISAGTLLSTLFLSAHLFAEEIDFEKEIAPILLTRCVECHNDTEASGGLNLTSLPALQAGSDSGTVLTPGHPEESYLWERVSAGDMPPEKQGKPQPLPEQEAQLLKAWIEAGAVWPQDRKLDLFEKTNKVRAGRDWWSLQPIVKPVLPAIENIPNDANAIDQFILAELNEQNLNAAPLAEPRQLLRRLYYDMIGLPPTAEELDKFAQSPTLQNYEQHVDELLASPQFGERWDMILARPGSLCGDFRIRTRPGKDLYLEVS
ncbi:MAG: DUF1549 domain-containing protein [Planctomycetaceae bacterium]